MATKVYAENPSIHEASACDGTLSVRASDACFTSTVQVVFVTGQPGGRYFPGGSITAFLSEAEIGDIVSVLLDARRDMRCRAAAEAADEPEIDEHPEDAQEAPPHEER